MQREVLDEIKAAAAAQYRLDIREPFSQRAIAAGIIKPADVMFLCYHSAAFGEAGQYLAQTGQAHGNAADPSEPWRSTSFEDSAEEDSGFPDRESARVYRTLSHIYTRHLPEALEARIDNIRTRFDEWRNENLR